MKSLLPLVALAAASPAAGQSLLIPHFSQNGGVHVAAVDPFDGSLQSASFIDMRAGGAPSLRPIQAVPVGQDWWVTDNVTETVHRWSGDGTAYVGEEVTGLGDVVGGVTAFGASWFCIGDPGAGAKLLARVDGSGVTTFPLTRRPQGLIEFQGELVYSHPRGLIRIDPVTGAEIGELYSVLDQGGFNQPTIRASTGNILVARQAGNQDVLEIDASGNLVNEFDVAAVLGIGLMFSAQELGNGDFLLSTDQGLFVVDPALTRSETIIDGIRCRYITATGSIDVGTTYCGPAEPNSTGRPATIGATGSVFAADNGFRLAAHDLPNGTTALIVVSGAQSFVPMAGGSEGNLCLAGPIGRYNNQIDFATTVGFIDQRIDLTRVPQASFVAMTMAGQTWNWQVWYRDQVGGQQTSNFTNGVSVTFQ